MVVLRTRLIICQSRVIMCDGNCLKSTRRIMIKDNLNILDFTLTEEEMAEIAKLNNGKRYYVRTDAALAGFAGWQPTYEV